MPELHLDDLDWAGDPYWPGHPSVLPGVQEKLVRYRDLLRAIADGSLMLMAAGPRDRCSSCSHAHPFGPCLACDCICPGCGWSALGTAEPRRRCWLRTSASGDPSAPEPAPMRPDRGD